MITAVIIDDERPAIKALENFLQDYPVIEVVETFINPLEAIKRIAVINPHLVFLDINMPQLQGVDAASQILDLCPDTDIIFVTAYDQYAVEAFELHALDYLLKPSSKARFHKTMQRVMEKNHCAEKKSMKKLSINCLGPFHIGAEDNEPIKWRSEKTKELFAFLLHNRGQVVSKDVLLETLWFDYDVKKAVHQMYNGIYYIRKTLKENGIDHSLIRIQGNYCLQLGDVTVDLDEFEEQYAGLNEFSGIKEIKGVLALYNGEYMEGSDWIWAGFERERYTKQYAEINMRLAKLYMENKDYTLAEQCLMIAYNKNPFNESITALMLELYLMINERNKASMHFLTYRKLLQEELGIEPGLEIQKIYSSFN